MRFGDADFVELWWYCGFLSSPGSSYCQPESGFQLGLLSPAVSSTNLQAAQTVYTLKIPTFSQQVLFTAA